MFLWEHFFLSSRHMQIFNTALNAIIWREFSIFCLPVFSKIVLRQNENKFEKENWIGTEKFEINFSLGNKYSQTSEHHKAARFIAR
jgi:hypothetical protein